MNWYKTATFTYEYKTLEPQDDLEENLIVLHELDYKIKAIESSPGDLSSEGIKEVRNRINYIALDFFENCKERIIKIFNEWNRLHPIENSNLWAKMVLENILETNSVEDILRYGISWGKSKIKPKTFEEYVSDDFIKECIRENFSYDPSFYETEAEYFLDKIYKTWRKLNKPALEIINDKNLDNRFLKFIYGNTDKSEFMYSLSEEYKVRAIDFEKCIKNELYPEYMSNFGYQIKEVKSNINSAIERLNKIDKNSSVQDMTIAISLALNVAHVFGNILEDYSGYVGENLSSRFLNLLNTGLPQQNTWDEELKEEFGIGKKSNVSALAEFV